MREMKWGKRLVCSCGYGKLFYFVKLNFHSPVAFLGVVHAHFTVQQDHAHYYNVRVRFVRPGFSQPATNSILTSFTYKQPPAYSLASINRNRRVNRLAPCKLVVRNRGRWLPAAGLAEFAE